MFRAARASTDRVSDPVFGRASGKGSAGWRMWGRAGLALLGPFAWAKAEVQLVNGQLNIT
jgi:hypothetical protein